MEKPQDTYRPKRWYPADTKRCMELEGRNYKVVDRLQAHREAVQGRP